MIEPTYKTVGELSGITKEIPKPKRPKLFVFPYVLMGLISLILFSIFILYNQLDDISNLEAEASKLNSLQRINNLDVPYIYEYLAPGLYADFQNIPSNSSQVRELLANIRPLDENGLPLENGKIGMLAFGDSYTYGEMDVFAQYTKGKLIYDVEIIEATNEQNNYIDWQKSSVSWENLEKKVEQKDLNPSQVQVLWIYMGLDKSFEGIDENIGVYQNAFGEIISNALFRYPNLQVVYLSSPRYAGLSRNQFIKEPLNFEIGYAVRNFISTNSGTIRKDNKEIALLWGPYIWNSDLSGASEFSLRADNYEQDGLSLNLKGKQRFAVYLFEDFSSSAYSKDWFKAK